LESAEAPSVRRVGQESILEVRIPHTDGAIVRGPLEPRKVSRVRGKSRHGLLHTHTHIHTLESRKVSRVRGKARHGLLHTTHT